MRRRWALMWAMAALAACRAAPEVQAPANANGQAPEAAPAAAAEAPATIPARFHGTYDSGPRACTGASEYRLVVTARGLSFHESIGTVREIASEGADEVRITADFQGEGESWTAVRNLRLAGGGARLVVEGDGEALERVRCTGSAAEPPVPALRWETMASGEGSALFLIDDEERLVTLFCPAGTRDLLVSVPAFRPVASEERMTFGAGGTALTLVADPGGDRLRGGVSGRGPIPPELRAILTGGEAIAVNYGAQDSGPHLPPPADAVAAFLAGCPD